jgi:hypothetical protein
LSDLQKKERVEFFDCGELESNKKIWAMWFEATVG